MRVLRGPPRQSRCRCLQPPHQLLTARLRSCPPHANDRSGLRHQPEPPCSRNAQHETPPPFQFIAPGGPGAEGGAPREISASAILWTDHYIILSSVNPSSCLHP